MTGVLAPEWRADQVGKRIQANFASTPDAFDFLLVRERQDFKFWIPLNGWISPVIPLLLGLAKVDAGWDSIESMPLVVQPDPEQWHLCVMRWLKEHREIRARLRAKCGRERWRTQGDIDGALVLCPSELVVPLKLWKRDFHVWNMTAKYGIESA